MKNAGPWIPSLKLSLLPTYDWYLREKIVSLVFIPDSYPYIFVAGRWDLTAVIGVSLWVRIEILAFLKVLGSQVALAAIRVLETNPSSFFCKKGKSSWVDRTWSPFWWRWNGVRFFKGRFSSACYLWLGPLEILHHIIYPAPSGNLWHGWLKNPQLEIRWFSS